MIEDSSEPSRPPANLLAGASLILDFDGTLVELDSIPDAVRVSDELRELLVRLKDRLSGRLAILTGRPLEQMRQLIHPIELPIGGSHGLETRAANGDLRAPTRPDQLDSAVAGLRLVERRHPGVLVEEKPLGVAIHFRQAPEAELTCREAAEAMAEATGLELQPGKMVFELKPPGGNKAEGVRALMGSAPFAGTRPIFLGDDWTDEDGFAAAQDLGGAGIYVGEPRPTAAHYRLDSVADALDWLEMAAEAVE